MPDNDQPAVDQQPPASGDEAAASTPAKTEDRADRQAAKYRLERNALRDQLARSESLRQQQQAELAEERRQREEMARQVASAQQTLTQHKETLRARLLTEAVRSRLGGIVTDATQQKLLMPGLLAEISAAGVGIDDDLQITGDIDDVLQKTLAPMRQSGSTAARLLGQTLPSSEDESTLSAAELMRRDLRRALK